MEEDATYTSSNSEDKFDVLKIEPSKLTGTLKLPPSKSHSMRWLTLACMDREPTKIEMWEVGEDVQALIDSLVQLGISWEDGEMIGGPLRKTNSVIDCKNSGTALRFLIAQVASCDFLTTLDGDASLRARSSLPLLRNLNVKTIYHNENSEYPLSLEGPFEEEFVEIDVSQTSQFHSALMLMAPRTKGFNITTKGDAVSRNHSSLTWELCKLTGARSPGKPWKVSCPDIVIPPDASMMAFAKLAGLSVENPPQEKDTIGHDLDYYELRDSNDLITPMAAWLALGEGGKITGAGHAAYKESNRLTKTVQMLSEFSIISHLDNDVITVPGNQIPIRPTGVVKTFGDHRIQMTAVLLASICGGLVEGSNLHRVAWPSFLSQLVDCGLSVKTQP